MEAKIFKAIADTMNDVEAVGKSSHNKNQNYWFRGIDAVMNALHPAMVKNRIFVVPEVLEQQREERQGKSGKLIYSICKIKYTFYADDGSSVSAIVIGEGMDSGDKATNKAMSIAFKYACFQVFCIPTEDIVDPDAESPELAQTSAQTITPEQIKKLKAEMMRTGITAKTVLSMAKAGKVEEIDARTYEAIMRKFRITPDAIPPATPPDAANDPPEAYEGLPFQ